MVSRDNKHGSQKVQVYTGEEEGGGREGKGRGRAQGPMVALIESCRSESDEDPMDRYGGLVEAVVCHSLNRSNGRPIVVNHTCAYVARGVFSS